MENCRNTGKPEQARRYAASVSDDDNGCRLDRFLAARIETLSRARLQQLIREGRVTALGNPISDPAVSVRMGQTFEVSVPEAAPSQLAPERISLAVVYEDDAVVVIDKPAGMVVHPGAGNPGGTLVNALLTHCDGSLSGIGGVLRPGIVHRLDKDTSGLMVVAKHDAAHRNLAEQFADHGRTGDLRREYLALVWGEPKPQAGRIEAMIGRHPASRIKMSVVRARGRQAVTHYRTEQSYRLAQQQRSGGSRNSAAISLLRCRLETGRTHQVRVHLDYIGTPIVGDPLYGTGFQTKLLAMPHDIADAARSVERQALHAAVLAFRHPSTGKVLVFESQLPGDIANLCLALDRLA